MVKLYPTDYIYGRAKYLFQFVLEEFMMFVDFIPPTCSAEAAEDPSPSLINEKLKVLKKRGRPKKIPPPEPLESSEPKPPKKRGRPRKNPIPTEPSIPPPQPVSEISQPEVQYLKPIKTRTKASKKKIKFLNETIVPLTSFL